MKVIAIEGIDGCGKTTQAHALVDKLSQLGYNARFLSFPRYDNEASVFIRRYLGGDYGEDPNAIDPYVAASFYALDRYDYFKKENHEDLDFLITDRYTTSNLIHQASKLEGREREDFKDWLEALEYEKLEIPKPDQVLFLDLPTRLSRELLCKREKTSGVGPDIHEKNSAYLEHAHECARELADELDWTVIDCSRDGEILPVEEISEKILKSLEDV